MSRDIKDILLFRSDISPFLVHLTRKIGRQDAKKILKSIIEQKKLVAGDSPVSDARFAINIPNSDYEKIKPFLRAVCLTETPLNEVHCLLEIKYRSINLEPYGLVFLKNKLRDKGVAPVLYFNNHVPGDKDDVFQALGSLIQNHKNAAAKLLPLVAVFGYHINPPSATSKSNNQIDFLWEREWRYPHINGDLKFTEDDIFIGLCPHDEIEHFEDLFEDVEFIDPMRNMEWYASKLVAARKRLKMKHSVV